MQGFYSKEQEAVRNIGHDSENLSCVFRDV